MRRWGPPAIVTLAAMAALTALTAGTAAKEARPAPTQATAPRDAGEPIMAIVSIKSQQVTFYDADGWILRAPVSTGITGRETPAGVFAVICPRDYVGITVGVTQIATDLLQRSSR
jgi:hypothetical protein